MSTRTRAAIAAGAAAIGALAVARPALDAMTSRAEARMNGVWPMPATPVSDRAAALHATLRVADLHADSLLFGRDLVQRSAIGHADIPRLIEGRVALQVLSMAVKTPKGLNIERNTDSSDDVLTLALAKRWPPATWRRLMPRVAHLAAQAHRFEERSAGRFRVLESREDLAAYLAERVVDQGMTAAILSIEGAHALDDDPANVDVVADLGIRMISPAHFFDTVFGGSAHGVEQGGLTRLGREMLRRMEARGVILDVAHASSRTIDEALGVSTRPVVASHTGVRGICDNARNLSDDQLDGDRSNRRTRWDRVLGDRQRRSRCSLGRPLHRVHGRPHRQCARRPGVRLGRRGHGALRCRERGAPHGCAPRRGPRRGRDQGRDGRERPARPCIGTASRLSACRPRSILSLHAYD